MRLSDKDPRIFSGEGTYRPLRRVWVLVWITLCAAWAVKVIVGYLGL